jgi:phage shock protein E
MAGRHGYDAGMRNPLLFVAFAGMLIAAAPATRPTTRPTLRKDVNVEEFDKLVQGGKHVILDVRTAEEYAAGHIPGAVLIDVKKPDFAERIEKLDKGKTYLVHCRSGVRSVTACTAMEKAGFKDCYNLLGGIKAWGDAGKPVEK